MLIFYIPVSASIYEEEWRVIKRNYNISDRDWTIDRVALELEGICKRNNIDFVNPTEAFKMEADRLKSRGERLYYIEDGHWGVPGHRLTARLLRDFIYLNYIVEAEES